jgi:hypothetical protein
MRCSALKAKTRRGFRPCRNTGNRASGAVENLLQQKFSLIGVGSLSAVDVSRSFPSRYVRRLRRELA